MFSDSNSMNLLYILNLFGVISFSVSGALKALNHKLDILGVVLLGVITVTGGGVMRDVTLNKFPSIFLDNIEIICAIFASFLSFLIGTHIEKRKKWIVYSDALGLAVFCALGSKIAAQQENQENIRLSNIIFTSVITCTGGGVLRDVLIGETPFILKKDVYATLAIAGAILYYLLIDKIPLVPVRAYIVSAVVFIARTVAIQFELSLPKGSL